MKDSLREKFRSGEPRWLSTLHLLRQFGGNVSVIQELLPTDQHKIDHDAVLPAPQLLCSHTCCVSSESPEHTETSLTELAMLRSVPVHIQGRL